MCVCVCVCLYLCKDLYNLMIGECESFHKFK